MTSTRTVPTNAPLVGLTVAALALGAFFLIQDAGGSPTPLNHLGYASILLAAHRFGWRGGLSVGLLDSDANPTTIMRYGVMSLPTLILYVGGQPVERITGLTSRERIEAKLLPHLAPQNA